MMDVAVFVGEQRGDGRDVGADQIAHRDGQSAGRGAAERQAGDGADVIFELARDRALDRPVAAVVDARRHFVEDGSLVGGEKFAGEDADIVELGGDLRSEEHTSELQSLMRISYAVFCLKKKK